MYPTKTIVPSKDIDTFWHTHILDTKKYTTDCEILFGKYFHHFPYFGMRGKKDEDNLKQAFHETNQLYLYHFGESPLSSGMADCGSLCSEPKPDWDGNNFYMNERPILSRNELTI